MRRALDLFCGAGGVTKGLQRAGFHVTGVDIDPQPNYCGDAFYMDDAVHALRLEDFDFIWASPPCQRYSAFSRGLGTAESFPDLIPAIRKRLRSQGTPWVIENVPGAPLHAPVRLCGSMFGLGVRRHRLFEADFNIRPPGPCAHTGLSVPVYGHGTPQYYRHRLGRNISIAEKQAAMGIDWMTREELSQAIPPAYAEHIGRQVPR